MTGVSRRSALAAAGTVLSASLSGCTGMLPVVGGGGKSQLTKYLETVRERTATYDGDRQAAIEDGWSQVYGPVIPGQGWHFVNTELTAKAIKRGSFRVEEPPILMFDTDGNLGCVEYGGPATKIPANPDLFSDVDAEDGWGTHQAATHVYADGESTVTPLPERSLEDVMTVDWWRDLGYVDGSIEPGDTVELRFGPFGRENSEPRERVVDFVTTHPDLHSVHLWVHEENPEGAFAPVHPDFARP